MNCGVGNNTVLPNATNGAPWSSRMVGLDVIVIHPSDPKACHANGTVTNYYIGVTSFTRNASFSLLAYATSADPITLVDGQPQTGQVRGVCRPLLPPSFRVPLPFTPPLHSQHTL